MRAAILLPCLFLSLFLITGCERDDVAEAEPEENGAAVPAVPENVSEPPAEAERSESGLAWVVLREGPGEVHPRPQDRIKVHYSGWTTDGEMFDSSVVRGEPAVFPLGRLIEGWVEGIQLMTEGDTFRFWIPGELAYDGRTDRPGAPQGMLVFDVELIEILDDDAARR
ncbi:FKBP-type peptidyl-prolyl cis-trans isomerase [Natronospira bacteriovora]|uniref:Peptidyl-prolyl cis-trans isomerase n=1 Tax=Natronospira bacteriovora TaxID=3069753 RepID=A0ABU0W6M4_9GAMM|nr:FKBP-type peptidyl-prolyl cis-trans isomerase [Natronospira sp. AB-CW4]MDQ2069584.1 FKBP-type peptidyl-prolyl cis-trans isomerase [Natronospira sp. AB-CW4]